MHSQQDGDVTAPDVTPLKWPTSEKRKDMDGTSCDGRGKVKAKLDFDWRLNLVSLGTIFEKHICFVNSSEMELYLRAFLPEKNHPRV